MARLIGFAWNKDASVDVDISAFESTSTYSFNRNREPEYFFSISNTSENVNCMETAPPDMAPICAHSTSGTDSQNVLPISAGPSLNTLNTTLHSPVPKIPRKYSISEKKTLFPLKKLIISRKSERIKEEIKSKSRKIESVKSPDTSGVQFQKMQKMNSLKQDSHNQKTYEDSGKKCS
jgi:hypothetical protein